MARLLLIGNSRWHCGEWHQGQLRRQWHEAPLGPGAEPPAEVPDLWAAVGPVPGTLAPWAGRRLGLAGVPLQACPPTLGVDRALAAWGAWSGTAAPVFVADAGTALSFTLVDKTGSFLGGRLMAGGLLQLRALHGATNALPALGGLEMNPTTLEDPWPTATAAAMAQGVLQGLAGAVALGFSQRPWPEAPWSLWLTGGDGEALLPLLEAQALRPRWAPNLSLGALGQLLGA